jgi:hypothetical protein
MGEIADKVMGHVMAEIKLFLVSWMDAYVYLDQSPLLLRHHATSVHHTHNVPHDGKSNEIEVR